MVFITFGYGAMIATYQNYAHEVWGMTNSAATVFMLLIGAGGLVSTPVIAKLSDTKGRKYTIVLGMIIFMAGAAAIIFFENIAAMRYIGFTVMGSGYAFVTIISFPMVLELSNTQNNGAFTSYYTLAFTIPKALTAYTSGVLLTRIGYSILFPYTLFFIILGLVLMVFVRHGNVVEIKRKQSEVTV
jgi:MFS family permease